jgi:hypothetical protein
MSEDAINWFFKKQSLLLSHADTASMISQLLRLMSVLWMLCHPYLRCQQVQWEQLQGWLRLEQLLSKRNCLHGNWQCCLIVSSSHQPCCFL